MRHVPAAHIGEVLADRVPAANDLRVAGLVVTVDDLQFGVFGVQGEQRRRVALLDTAAQRPGIEPLAGHLAVTHWYASLAAC